MPGTFTCSTHRVLIYEQGGTDLVMELTPVLSVQWQRIRDNISSAEAVVPSGECCTDVANLRTVIHEMHMIRDGVMVWCGPITRIEYEHEVVRIFAEDMLWVAKRKALTVGYSNAYPAIGQVLDRMDWLVRNQCFSLDSRWNMVTPNHLHKVTGPSDPRTSRVVPAYSTTVWSDFDKYAEDGGADYCVVGRDVYYFDTQLAWAELPDLNEDWISQFPVIVEYGNQLATRVFVTNGKGYAGGANADSATLITYGTVDNLINDQRLNGESTGAPSSGELAQWSATAGRNLKYPSPLGVVIPANTSLMPGAPWTIDMLIPGAWFNVSVERMCRVVSEAQRINEVVVTESAPNGEQVSFTAITAPSTRVDP